MYIGLRQEIGKMLLIGKKWNKIALVGLTYFSLYNCINAFA